MNCESDQISEVLSSESKLSQLLLQALVQNKEENVAILLDIGANPSARYNSSLYNNGTPLHYCARNRLVAIANLLLMHDPSGVNALDSDNYTPLHWAAYQGHVEVAKILLEHGASQDLKNKGGYTALGWAEIYDQQEMINLFKNYVKKK